MRHLILIASATLLLVSSAMAQVITPSEMMRSSVQNVIRPAMKAFERDAQALVADFAALCGAPSEVNLDGTRDSFAKTALSFGRIEHLRMGPLMEDNRVDRLLFWPDRQGIALRQVQAALAAEEETGISADRLRTGSVAIQGLGALEFILYGTGAEALAAHSGFRCAFGAAVAANVASISSALVEGWADPQGIASHLMAPDAAYDDYRTYTEALEGIVGLMAHGIEAARDKRVLPFLARDGKPAKPKQALFWRSGLTMPMLRANLEAVRQMVEFSGLASDADLAHRIEEAFGRALDAIDHVTLPVEAAVQDPAQSAALDEVVAATQSLQQLIGEELSASLGLSVGFSALDGD